MKRTWLCAGVSASLMLLAVSGYAQYGQATPSQFCQILDSVADPIVEVGFTVVNSGEFEDYGKSGFIEIDALWEFAYFRDVLQGDVDLKAVLDLNILSTSAGLQLPDQLVILALDAGWTWRNETGTAIQTRFAPGIYSDIERIEIDAVAMPFSLAVIQAFNPQCSGILGAEIRPRFQRVVMPIAGVVWSSGDQVRIEATLPEAKAVWYVNPDWRTHLLFDWRSLSYDLREKGSFDRDRMDLEEIRAGWGLTRTISEQLQATLELGYVFARSVEFEETADPYEQEIDIEDEPYVRIAVGGTF